MPGTALTSLLRNGTFGNYTNSNNASSTSGSGDSSSNDIVDRVYVDDNLASVPDINATGRGFYTFWYRTEVRTHLFSSLGVCALCTFPAFHKPYHIFFLTVDQFG